MALAIRTRLAIWFSGIVLIGVAIFATVLYVRFQRSIDSFLTDHLGHEAHKLERVLRSCPDKAAIGDAFERIASVPERYHDFYCRVLDPKGEPFVESPGIPDWLTFPPEILKTPTEPHVTTATEPASHGSKEEPLRVYTMLLKPETCAALPDGGFMQIAQRTRFMEKRLDRFLRSEFFGIAILLAFVAIAGWIVARKALSPVAAITQHASEIGASDLARRLPKRGTNDELDRLVDVLNAMLDRLQQAFSRNRRFAAMAAHQLRTPLTGLRGELELLGGRADVSNQMRPAVAALIADVDRMVSLCRRMLLLAKVEDGGGATTPVGWHDLDIGELASDLCIGQRATAEAKGLRLTGPREQHPVVLAGQPTLLGEAIHNLIHNAITYTPEGGEVVVRVTSDDDEAQVIVEDSGPGIDEGGRTEMFAHFARGHDSSGDGFGLGLPIAQGIAQQHGGRIEVGAATIGGARFTLILPLHGNAASG